MTFSDIFFLQGQQKSLITKSHTDFKAVYHFSVNSYNTLQ